MPPGIVDVVLAMNRVARGLQEITDGRAERREPPVTDVQRARWIGRHEFQQDARRLAGRLSAKLGAAVENVLDFLHECRGAQVKIDEAGACHFDLADRLARRNVRDQHRGELAGVLARGLGESHGEVAGEVSVARVAGSLHGIEHGEIGRDIGKRRQLGHGGFENFGNYRLHLGLPAEGRRQQDRQFY